MEKKKVKRKHPERRNTIWNERFFIYKGEIQPRSARHDKETYSYWKYIKPLTSTEIQASYTELMHDMKHLKEEYSGKEYLAKRNTIRIKFDICNDTYELYKFIESNKDFPTYLILEGVDGKPVTVTVNPPSTDKKDYSGFMGALGYITTKGVQIGESGLFIKSSDKGREWITKWMRKWHKPDEYWNFHLGEKIIGIECMMAIESDVFSVDNKSKYWKWRYDKDTSNKKIRDKKNDN